MSSSTFFVSEAAVRHFKSIATRRISGVSSSHLSEGIASALGFKTYAALRAALEGKKTVEVQKPSNALLVARLQSLGYSELPEDFHVLPELDQSYSPFRNFPLRKPRGPRWLAWRNLIVAAVNAGLAQNLFGLAPGENWWEEADALSGGRSATYEFSCGGVPAIASVTGISGDELSVHAVLKPRADLEDPSRFFGLKDGDAFARCYVERRLGAWIQEGGHDLSCKRAAQSFLSRLRLEPSGYADHGSFIM